MIKNQKLLMITEITYTYQCGGNYKYHKTLYFEGQLTKEEKQNLITLSESFIPEQINLKSLQPSLWDDELDHPFHEITFVGTIEESNCMEDRTINEFYNNFINITWDENASTARSEREIKED